MSESQIHPHWSALISWLAAFGVETEKILVQPRSVAGAGYGLFASTQINPSAPLFTIPAKALLNSLTLGPLYPASEKLSCTQLIALHLSLNRPVDGLSKDVHFGPYISVLPENFDAHPFTWLWKSKHRPNFCTDFELALLQNLPPRITQKLEKMRLLGEKDKTAIETYMSSQPTLKGALHSSTFQDDYLWAWLNVNTRCIYHRIRKSRSDADNMTLCPILDFANHATDTATVYPRPTRGELWDTGPSVKRQFGENFTLLAPSQQPTKTGEELFLKYGFHSNATLFTEYGFLLPNGNSEVEVLEIVEDLFSKRGPVGAWMKEVLINEGYWGDWTLHSSPEPAHPSYRLITALRLYCCVSNLDNIPDDPERHLKGWRDVIYGVSMSISEENERFWRQTLLELCQTIVRRSQTRISSVRSLREVGFAGWLDQAWSFIEVLWEEEVEVGLAVIASIENDVEF